MRYLRVRTRAIWPACKFTLFVPGPMRREIHVTANRRERSPYLAASKEGRISLMGESGAALSPDFGADEEEQQGAGTLATWSGGGGRTMFGWGYCCRA